MRFSKMKVCILAFAASTVVACGALAFEPSVALKYDGADMTLAGVKADAQDAVSTWEFKTPDAKVGVSVLVEEFAEFPGFYRMTARVKNLSDSERSGLVQDLKVFAASLPTPSADATVTLDLLRGSPCAPIDFEAYSEPLPPSKQTTLATPSGRSSNEVSPFIEANVDERNGWFFAIGWTGRWSAEFANENGALNVKIGMMKTGFQLKPYESLLQPSVLFAKRVDQTRAEFKTIVHRFMVKHNAPRNAEGNVCSPIVALTAGGGNKTPQMMIDVLNYGLKSELDFDVYWVDAGWYGAPHEDEHYSNCGPNWYRYVGDWRVNTTTHPTGDLMPIANAVHNAGKRFLLWFEPERIHPETPIAIVDPFNQHHGLGYYGDPRSFDYIEKTIFGVIEKHHIDVYRQDFNMDPAGAWDAIDAQEGENRVGIAEAKHVEGLYRFLDDMRARFPWILQENCASGGRRIDLEMVKRAHSYCRSDYYIGQKEGDTCFTLGQNMTHNLTPYLPFQGGETNCVPNFDDYGFMSVASSGTVFTPTDLDGGIVKREFSAEETAWFKKMLGWAHRLKRYYMGDFYQLTGDATVADDAWCAWSCDLPEEGEGFALAFRRAKSDVASMTFELPAIDPTAKYELEFFDGTKKTVDGSALANWRVDLPEARSFALVVYKKL
ncbi:MAG: alpha-galactosidase [Thermoguttaceae bacterium]|nr:alpha-galactosidase [Thermoguttaceae bacterium]